MIPVHIAIINLVCRPSRRQRILGLANKLLQLTRGRKLSVQSINVIEAVDGVQNGFAQLAEQYGLEPFSNWACPDPENRLPSSWRVGQTSGGIASGLSHLDVARWARQTNKEYVLVMEDDCVISDLTSSWTYFESCFFDANEFIPDWHMLMLGAAGHRVDIASPLAVPESTCIEIAGFSYLTTMYFLSPKGAIFLDNARPHCLENGLAFDELHNALAKKNSRPDVLARFAQLEPLVLLCSLQSFVRQDPYDCVHDTAVSSKGRASCMSPDLGHLIPHPLDDLTTWWRREPHDESSTHKWRSSLLKKKFGKRGFLHQILAARNLDSPAESFPQSFDAYYKAKQKRRYRDELPQTVLFRE